MAKFRDIKTLEKFASVHASMHNHFNRDRHFNRRNIFKQRRSAALREPLTGDLRAALSHALETGSH